MPAVVPCPHDTSTLRDPSPATPPTMMPGPWMAVSGLLMGVAHALSCEDIEQLVDAGMPVETVVVALENASTETTADDVACLASAGRDVRILLAAQARAGVDGDRDEEGPEEGMPVGPEPDVVPSNEDVLRSMLGRGETAAGSVVRSTKGRGAGGRGFGTGDRTPPATSQATVSVYSGRPVVIGALDKSLIDKVVNRHMNQLRYCHQRELNDHPDLAGSITVQVVIARDGSVSKASTKRSTMANEAVEECINAQFRRFRFPEPKGGGIVIVSYPLTFSPE